MYVFKMFVLIIFLYNIFKKRQKEMWEMGGKEK